MDVLLGDAAGLHPRDDGLMDREYSTAQRGRTDSQTGRQKGRQTDRQAETHTHTHTQADRQTDRQTHTQTDRHTDRQTDGMLTIVSPVCRSDGARIDHHVDLRDRHGCLQKNGLSLSLSTAL